VGASTPFASSLSRGVRITRKALPGAPLREIRCGKANGKNDLHSHAFSAHGSGAS